MKDDRDEFIPFWPQTAAPSAPYGGILGQLAEPDIEPWNDPRLATYPETSWHPTRPLHPFLQPPGSWDPSGPASRHMPAAADTGFPAQSAEPAVPPWDDPRRVPLKALLRIGLPATFSPVPPLEHLDSGKYWPVAPAPSGANEQPPAHGFYVPPMPQAPSWDQMPAYPVDGAARSISQLPSPTSWATAARPVEYPDLAKYWGAPSAPSAASPLPPTFPPAPPLEHLDSAKHWPVAPAPSGANEQPPSHGFYFPPVPQAPSWDSVPADASMIGLGQLFPQPPGPASWLSSAAGASTSSADEALMADDARRVAADRLKRGMQRTIPTAPPPEHLSPSKPLVHGFYLSPVGQGPSWERVVPTATPWSVAPKLPSPTAWGDTLSGPECSTSGGQLTCITPGGKQVTVPAEGLDDELKIAPGHPNYHYYNTTARSYRGDPRSHMGGVINEPTPGPSFLVRPATPEGTRNEAAPWYVHLLRRDPLEFFSEGIARWPVKSYSTTDQNGAPVVVNVTQPGHPLYPGVVMRYETTSPSGSTIHNEGTGLGWVQGPSPPATPAGSLVPQALRDWANDYVWRRQSEDLMGIGRHRPKGLPLGG